MKSEKIREVNGSGRGTQMKYKMDRCGKSPLGHEGVHFAVKIFEIFGLPLRLRIEELWSHILHARL